MRASANAKINIGLRVGGIRPDGFHPVHGLVQSIGLSDRLSLDWAEEDAVIAPGGRPVVDGWDNLAWKAVSAVRARSSRRRPLRLELDKHIPVAAGLGGGSADAAAALVLAARLLGVGEDELSAVAPGLGSDVPFCLVGGLAEVAGRGDRVRPLPFVGGYGIALVVPPVELATVDVYRAWDDLGGPAGPAMPERDLPPGLREYGPIANDLYPAAVAMRPEVEEWRTELASAWGRPVLMSGSGPSLFGFFLDLAEADDAVAAVPVGARHAEAVEPVTSGWMLLDDEGPGAGDAR